jgi:hypothetical protein
MFESYWVSDLVSEVCAWFQGFSLSLIRNIDAGGSMVWL